MIPRTQRRQVEEKIASLTAEGLVPFPVSFLNQALPEMPLATVQQVVRQLVADGELEKVTEVVCPHCDVTLPQGLDACEPDDFQMCSLCGEEFSLTERVIWMRFQPVPGSALQNWVVKKKRSHSSNAHPATI